MKALRLKLLFILGAILLLAGMFIATDVYAIIDLIDQKASFVMKFMVSCLCATVAFLIPKSDALSDRDYKLIKTTFAFVILADFLLVFLQTFLPQFKELINMLGIVVFMIVQTLLIIRHATGFKTPPGEKAPTKFRIISALCIYIPGIIAVIILHNMMSKKMLVEIIVYASMVTTSTWFGVNVLTRDTFPKTNRIMIATGMLLFLCCDISVGIMTFETVFLPKEIATALVYVFYAPALLLLAFSGYKKQPLSCES